MHELSLLENVREILEDYAYDQQFSKVHQVTLEIGNLSCVEPEALRFGFDVVMKGSLAEQAELIIRELPGLGECRQCHQSFEMLSNHDPCPHCGQRFVTVLQGTEMKIKDLVVS